MATTPNQAHAKPAMRAPKGEQLTFAEFDGVSLWCTFTTDDEQVGLQKVWVNGEWADAYALFGAHQYAAWANAVEVAAYGDADALASEILEERQILAHQIRTGVFA